MNTIGKNDDGKNQILEYIKLHGVTDKDSLPKKKTSSKKLQVRKGVTRVILDLHGMRSIEARQKIISVFDSNRNNGIREILIIHGKGFHSSPDEGPVLKNLVRSMLENELRSRVQSFKIAPSRDGGDGATVVVLR